MKKLILAFLLFNMVSLGLSAANQSDHTVYVGAEVFDASTDLPLKGAKIIVADSLGTVLTDSLGYTSYTSMRQAMESVTYKGTVPYRAKYTITISYPGLETATLTRTMKPNGRSLSLGEIYLYRTMAEKRLNEVTVTATRVKMIMKGDTIEYDASAFRLPHGSMLDALIQELPGATLDENGRITVNGEFVSTLLVNGRKFFSGDPNVALRNLPNYTVKNIQVYRKEPEEFSVLKPEQKAGRDKSKDPLVMDVNLKREYMNGWLANFELGGGSSLDRADLRWIGRFFAMRYTKISYVALYGTANNLNDSEKADSRGQWYKPRNTSGQTTTKRAGFEFNTDWRDQSGNGVNTKIDFRRQTDLTAQQSSGESFLAGGNTFSRSHSTADNATTAVNWSGEISRRFNFGRPWFEATAYYNHGTERRTRTDETGTSAIPDVFVKPGTAEFEQDMTYWREQTSGAKSDTYGGSLRFIGSIYTSSSDFLKPWLNYLSINASASMEKTTRKEDGTDRIVYPFTDNGLDEALRTSMPSRKHNFAASTSIGFKSIRLGETRLDNSLDYRYSNKFDYGKRDMERANLAPSAESFDNWLIDRANSYRTTRREQLHSLEPEMTLLLPREFRIQLACDFGFSNRHITDLRGGANHLLRRSATTFDPLLSIGRGSWWGDGYGLKLRMTQQLPEMMQMLDVRDNSNPLLLYLGNPDLRKTSTYNANIYFRKNFQSHARGMNFSLDYSRTDNNIAMARTYDRQTGLVTLRPQNISGSWRADGNFSYNQNFGRGDCFYVRNTLRPGFRHSLDYASDSDVPSRNAVDSWNISNNFEMRYSVCKEVKLRAMCNVDWSRFNSQDDLFAQFSYTDINYGLGINATPLPNLTIDTDLTAYCRSGYGDPTMNRTDLVWNVTVSYPFGPSKQWTVKATGFDLLQQLPDVQRTVNAQGRSEVRINSQPAYALLTLTYRLDIKPKK